MKLEMPRNRLKKLALFVALLFVLVPMVQAQVGAIRTLTLRTQDTLPGTLYHMGASKAIDHFSKAVTYYETSIGGQVQGHFLLNLGGLSSYIFDLPSGISVSDFETDTPNEALFFCGKHKVGDHHVGVYGHVAFNTTTLSADYWHSRVPRVASLDKMVLCRENSAREIFATAKDTSGESKIFFAMCQSSTSAYWVMNVRAEERLYDVALTDDYAVFLGYESDLGGLSLRKFRRDSPMNTEKDRVYCFVPPAVDVLSTPIVTDLRATLAKDEENDLAVAFMTSMDNNIYGTKVWVFDVMTMTNMRTQTYKMNEKMDVLDMAYAGTEKTLAIVQDGDPLGNTSGYRSVVCLKPYLANPYVADILSWPGALWQSIDAFPEDALTTRHILLGRSDMGRAEWTLKDLGTTSMPSGCHSTYELPVRIEEKAPKVEIDDALHAIPQNGMPYIGLMHSTTRQISSSCVEQ